MGLLGWGKGCRVRWGREWPSGIPWHWHTITWCTEYSPDTLKCPGRCIWVFTVISKRRKSLMTVEEDLGHTHLPGPHPASWKLSRAGSTLPGCPAAALRFWFESQLPPELPRTPGFQSPVPVSSSECSDGSNVTQVYGPDWQGQGHHNELRPTLPGLPTASAVASTAGSPSISRAGLRAPQGKDGPVLFFQGCGLEGPAQ